MFIWRSLTFKHDPNKKGKGRRRPRAASPTSSPDRNSKGDGKGADGGAKGTPKLSDKSPSRIANVQTSRRNLPNGNSCIYWHVPTCVFKHTANSADEKKISATIAIHIPANDKRQIPLRKIQSDDKTQFRMTLHHLANKYVLKK